MKTSRRHFPIRSRGGFRGSARTCSLRHRPNKTGTQERPSGNRRPRHAVPRLGHHRESADSRRRRGHRRQEWSERLQRSAAEAVVRFVTAFDPPSFRPIRISWHVKKQFTLATILLVVTAACIVFAALRGMFEIPGYRITKPVDPFPNVVEIARMSAFIYDHIADVPEFDVPPSHWSNVRSEMLPAEVDRSEVIAVWEVLGSVKMVTKNGREITVDVYNVPDVGAFSIDGKYFRGGNSEALLAAIEKAHAASGARNP